MKGMQDGPVVIDRDGTMSGMVTGDVIVRSGVRASISGMVSGDVVIEEGAAVTVSGVVDGRVIGSPLSVSGMVGR